MKRGFLYFGVLGELTDPASPNDISPAGTAATRAGSGTIAKNFVKFTINLDFSIDNYDKSIYNIIVNDRNYRNSNKGR